MSIKAQLASLFEGKDLPMEEFKSLQAFKDIEPEEEILKKLSEFNLPEITKLICGSDHFEQAEWAQKYDHVKGLYRIPEFDVPTALFPYYKDAGKFENEILRYVNLSILSRFKNFFDEKNEKLSQLKKERDSLRRRINAANKKNKKNEEEKENKQEKPVEPITESAVTVQKEHAELKAPVISESSEPSTEVTDTESALEKFSEDEQKLAELLEKVTKKADELKPWKKHIDKIEEYMEKCCSPEVEVRREQAYEAINSIKMPEEEEFLHDFIHNGIVPADIAPRFKDRFFCNRILQCLEKGSLKDYAMPILAQLYSEGAVDFAEGEFAYFVEHHPVQLAEFLTEKFSEDPRNVDNEDLSILFDMAVKSVLRPAEKQGRTAFVSLWNCFESTDNWRWLLGKVLDYQTGNINETFSYYLLGVTGRAAKAANDFLSGYDDPEIGLSLMDVYSEILDLENVSERELILGGMRTVVQNSRKTVRRLNVAERKLNSQGQEVFSATYLPVSRLEELAMNLRQSNGEIGCKLVARQLIDMISDLREGLETLGVSPVVDIEDWKKGREVEFDPEIHRTVMEGTDVPEKVNIRTMGFTYQNDEGEQKQLAAEVYIQKPEEAVKQSKQNDSKEFDGNQSKQNGSNGKHGKGKLNRNQYSRNDEGNHQNNFSRKKKKKK